MLTETSDGQVSLFVQDGSLPKMSQVCSVQTRGKISASSCSHSSALAAVTFMSLDLTPGSGNLLGEFYWEILSPWRGESSMLNTGASPRGVRECTLSSILQAGVPPKYYLTRKACIGILRRAAERGKALPPQLELALMLQAGVITAGFLPQPPKAFHINQREEVIDLGETAGALLAKGILSKCEYGYKVLGSGKVSKKVTVQASAFSASAKEAIEAAGGKAEVI